MFGMSEHSLLLTVLFLFAGCSAHPLQIGTENSPFRSIKATKEIVENYELVEPVIIYKDNALPHPSEMVVQVLTQSDNHTLVLSMNKMIMPSHFKSVYYDEQGIETVDEVEHANCYYQGSVEGHPEWRVAISTCHGLQGEFGDVEDKEIYFHVEPLDIQNTSMEQVHAFYLDSEYEMEQGGGIHDEIASKMLPLGKEWDNNVNTGKQRVLREVSAVTRYVEWVVINDKRQYVANGASLMATIQRAFSIANGVDVLFSQLGIRVVLTNSITFTSADKFTVAANSDKLLENFKDFVNRTLPPTSYDSIMLITGIDIEGGTQGIGYFGKMCSELSIGVAQDGGRTLKAVVSTASHELGHIFNMNHDDGRGCKCAEQQCVMSAYHASPPPAAWSSCSVADLRSFLASGGDVCLLNPPALKQGATVCTAGFNLNSDGITCDEIDECAVGTDNCKQTCTNTAGSFTCGCNPGFTLDVADGISCLDDDECTNGLDTCEQICINNVGSFTCDCTPGYSLNTIDGETCLDINECAINTDNCQQICTNTISSFTCGCNPGYTLDADGMSCSDNNECMDGTHNCQQTCTNIPGSFTCSCDPGYTLDTDGGSCLDINECAINTDNCQQTCANTAGSFTCGCTAGYTLDVADGATCLDDDECADDTDDCQQNCANTMGSFTCSCNPGYILLDTDGASCLDNNECTDGTNNCQQTCTNTVGSFICTCDIGYTLDADGGSCPDDDECTDGADNCQQLCTNTAGSFTCSCNPGYTLGTDGASCLDNNECTDGTDNCQQICVNTVGSFTCDCNTGYSLDGDGATCLDNDECTLATDDCDQICINNIGSFTCDCNLGFNLEADGRTCLDSDECTASIDDCEQVCINTRGSFMCDCDPGYSLDSNGRNCSDIDECTLDQDDCQQVCNNTIGSFVCDCDVGYFLDNDGRSCPDIDECTSDLHDCEQLCNNTQGSFNCTCFSGYSLNDDGQTCMDNDECSLETDDCNQLCTNTIGSFNCSCIPGYELEILRECLDINECFTGTDNCQQDCNNTVGSFMCPCRNGFSMNTDQRTCSLTTIVMNVVVEVVTDTSAEVSWDLLEDIPEVTGYMVYYLQTEISEDIDLEDIIEPETSFVERSIMVSNSTDSVVVRGLEGRAEHQFQVSAVAEVNGDVIIGERSIINNMSLLVVALPTAPPTNATFIESTRISFIVAIAVFGGVLVFFIAVVLIWILVCLCKRKSQNNVTIKKRTVRKGRKLKKKPKQHFNHDTFKLESSRFDEGTDTAPLQINDDDDEFNAIRIPYADTLIMKAGPISWLDVPEVSLDPIAEQDPLPENVESEDTSEDPSSDEDTPELDAGPTSIDAVEPELDTEKLITEAPTDLDSPETKVGATFELDTLEKEEEETPGFFMEPAS